MDARFCLGDGLVRPSGGLVLSRLRDYLHDIGRSLFANRRATATED
jgi:hypothetical protein